MLKKNSQTATHVSKNSILRQKTHVKKNSHNQNPHYQNLFTTKNHVPKKVNSPPTKKKKKKPMPHQKFHHNKNVSHIHT